jgi:hypothetical protein
MEAEIVVTILGKKKNTVKEKLWTCELHNISCRRYFSVTEKVHIIYYCWNKPIYALLTNKCFHTHL